MKRVLRFVGSLAGISALISILIFASTVLAPQNNSMSSTHQSAQQPYPPPYKSTTEIAVMIDEDGPYPPPSQPTGGPIPKSQIPLELTSTPKPTLIFTQTPLALPTQSGTLSAGLKIMYAETNGVTGTTMIWLANVNNINKERKMLATISNKVGYGVQGLVAPDGNRIAYLIIPSNTSEKSARTNGGELWIMNSDGSNAHLIANQMGYLCMWSPDSLSITAGRWEPLENSPDSEWRKVIFLVEPDNGKTSILVSDEKSADIQPVGWSKNGQFFYYATRTNILGSWELWMVNILSGLTQFLFSSPYEIADIPVLSPDGIHLLFTATQGNQQYLVLLSIDGQDQKVLVKKAINNQSSSQYSGIWSSNSQDILLYIPPEDDQKSHIGLINLAGEQTSLTINSTSGESFFIPRSWSPDGSWILASEYPFSPQSAVYLISIKSGDIVKIPLILDSNWITLYGWVDR